MPVDILVEVLIISPLIWIGNMGEMEASAFRLNRLSYFIRKAVGELTFTSFL